jgi:inosine-uridine nucleoside N-ribohydrolase
MKKLVMFFPFMICIAASAQKKKVIIDADTGNELDDLYAIAAAVLDTNLEILAINATHFNNTNLLVDSFWHATPTKNINTVMVSHEFNRQLLNNLCAGHIPLLVGANRMIGDPWGGTIPRKNEASEFMIKTAGSYSPHKKLPIITLGALTNVASAVLLDSSIADKIVIYMLGCWYDTAAKTWNKSEFNIRNDLNAFDYLLNHPKVEMHIMTANASYNLQFYKSVCAQMLSGNNPLFQQLIKRWDEIHGAEMRILWDLAIIDAFIHPEWCSEKAVFTLPENTQRKVFVYTLINTTKMEDDFWLKMKHFEQTHPLK